MPLFRLLRVAGVFTAIADIMAGYLILRFYGAGQGNLRSLPFILGASACLYMAGMTWNDVFDADADCKNRPERPIPCGAVSLTAGVLIAAILTVVGLLLAMTAGFKSFLVTCVLLTLILGYNAGLKRIEILGPLAMGACRGMNLVLGMSAHPDLMLLLAIPLVHVPPILLAAYTACVTVLAGNETPAITVRQDPAAPPDPAAENEDQADSDMETEIMPAEKTPGRILPPPPKNTLENRPCSIMLILSLAAIITIPLTAAWIMPHTDLALIIFGLLVLLLACSGYTTLRQCSFASVRRFVGTAIAGMVLLDAGFVASVALVSPESITHIPLALPSMDGLAGVALVAAMIIPTVIFKQRFAVT